MALTGYRSWAVTNSGDTIASAAVEVRRKADNTLASLFTDAGGGTPIVQPFTAGTDGSFEFYTEPDRYDLLVGSGLSQQTIPIDIADGRAQVPWPSRAQAVTDIAGGFVAANGTIKSDGTVQYIASSGATAISDMLGWLPFGVPESAHFGTVGDGVTNDTTALRAFATYFDAQRVTQSITAKITPGEYLLTDYVRFFEAASGDNDRSTLIWDSVTFICDYDRDGTVKDRMIQFGNPDTLPASNSSLDIDGRCLAIPGGNSTHQPVAFYMGATSQSNLNGIRVGSGWNNMGVELHGVQNNSHRDWTIFAGGKSFEFEDPGTSTYTQSGTTLTRAAGTYEFPTDCVGKVIEIQSPTPEVAIIQSRTSITEVELNISRTDATGREIVYGSCAPSTTSASADVVLDGPVTNDMVGLFVGIPRAGASGRILWAHISSVNPGTSTITLNKTASVTLDPVTNPLTETTEIAVPVIGIRSDKVADSGPFTNGISQLRFHNIQVEQFRGVAVGVDDAEFLHFNQTKFHGDSSPTFGVFSTSMMWANRAGGTFIGEFDSRSIGRYKSAFADQTLPFDFIDLTCRMKNADKLLRVDTQNFDAGLVTYGQLAIVGLDAGTKFTDIVDDTNASPDLGHTSPLRFILPDQNTLKYGAAEPRRSWTPEVADASTGGNVAAVTASEGFYQRLSADLMWLTVRIINIDTTGLTGGNNLFIRNLPENIIGGNAGILTVTPRLDNVTFSGTPIVFSDNADAFFLIQDVVSGSAASPLTVSAFTSGSADIRFSAIYPVLPF